MSEPKGAITTSFTVPVLEALAEWERLYGVKRTVCIRDATVCKLEKLGFLPRPAKKKGPKP